MTFEKRNLLSLLALPLAAVAATATFSACARKTSMEGRSVGIAPAPSAGDQGKKGSADQGSSQRPQGAFLAWNDFEPIDRTKLELYTKQDVIANLSRNSIFYRNFPSATQSAAVNGGDSSTACERERMEKGFKSEVNGDTVTLTYNLNKICEPDYDAEDDLRRVRMIQCVGVDLSALKNKTERELSGILDNILYVGGLCEKAIEVREFYNFRRAVTVIQDSVQKPSSLYPISSAAPAPSANPTVRQLERNVYILAMMSPTGEPCTAKRKDGNWVYETECWMKDRSENSAGDQSPSTTLPVDSVFVGSAKLKDIVLPIDSKDTWLKSGVAQLEFPFWTGTLTFANGGAPRLVLKSSQGEAVDQLLQPYSPVLKNSVSAGDVDADDKTLEALEAEVAAANAELDSLKK